MVGVKSMTALLEWSVLMVEIHYEYKLLGVIFFEIKLLLQPNGVFDSESNNRNFSSLA